MTCEAEVAPGVASTKLEAEVAPGVALMLEA